mgnify:CR=1 FL=1
MGISRAFARDGAQAEALGGVEIGGFDLAVVEHQAFRLSVFQEQFAVVHTGQGVVQHALHAVPVHAGTVEEQVVGGGKIGHGIPWG